MQQLAEAPLPKKLGIIAGSGNLPVRVARACNDAGYDVTVISFTKNTEGDYAGFAQCTSMSIGAIGKAIKALKRENITDVVLAGKVTRPSLSTILPDKYALKLITMLSKSRQQGDHSLLSTVVDFIAQQGFNILGVDEVAEDLVMPEGILTHREPKAHEREDIEFGKTVAREIGQLDIGQCIAVQNKTILAVEGLEGTDQLIKRTKDLALSRGKPILVKVKKPVQDNRVDMPTIGMTTITNVANAGFAGLAIEARQALIIDKRDVIAYANDKGLFLIGI